MKCRVLIIVQNLPVPFDPRVWPEYRALASVGYQVSAVCSKGSGDLSYRVVDTAELRKAMALGSWRQQAPHRVRLLPPRHGMADARGKAIRHLAVIQAGNPVTDWLECGRVGTELLGLTLAASRVVSSAVDRSPPVPAFADRSLMVPREECAALLSSSAVAKRGPV